METQLYIITALLWGIVMQTTDLRVTKGFAFIMVIMNVLLGIGSILAH